MSIARRYLLPALSAAGRTDVALQMAQTRSYPGSMVLRGVCASRLSGWGYMAMQGATSLWETWYGSEYYQVDSWNHVMFGSQVRGPDLEALFSHRLRVRGTLSRWRASRTNPDTSDSPTSPSHPKLCAPRSPGVAMTCTTATCLPTWPQCDRIIGLTPRSYRGRLAVQSWHVRVCPAEYRGPALLCRWRHRVCGLCQLWCTVGILRRG
jgi:hypothetical protein